MIFGERVGWRYNMELGNQSFGRKLSVSLSPRQLIQSEYYFIRFQLFVNWGMSANLVLAAIQRLRTMKRILRSLKLPLALYLVMQLSCHTNDSIDTKNIFDKALKSDSLSYYFPSILNDSVERRNPNYRDFKQKWYSSSLYSFKEPILYTKTDSQTIYRLLWLRSFHKPVCFTLKELRGNYFLNAKTLDRQPAFYPEFLDKGNDENTGKEIFDTIQKADRFALIDFDTLKVLRNWQWEEIENYFSKLGFWNSPVADPADEGTTDGSNWIVEGRENGKYHFIDRRNAKGDLKDFGKYLIKLSGLRIDDHSIY